MPYMGTTKNFLKFLGLLALGFCQVGVVLSVFQLTDVVFSIVMGFCFVLLIFHQ